MTEMRNYEQTTNSSGSELAGRRIFCKAELPEEHRTPDKRQAQDAYDVRYRDTPHDGT